MILKSKVPANYHCKQASPYYQGQISEAIRQLQNLQYHGQQKQIVDMRLDV